MSVIGTFTGTLGDALNATPAGGIAHDATKAVAGFALGDVASWVLTGTEDALRQVASAISATTTPNLDSTWFSSTYWRVAALAAMLTVPFICAAAVQALARSDMALLAKSVFGYLPVSLIGVSLAAPLTMLLLAATDQMSSVVSATGIKGGAHFLEQAAAAAGALSAANGSLFFAVIIGLFAIMAALALAVELLVREAAVYVVVLMLPLAFAAMVWPARRVWATRLVELLVSLILSKFVIVAVLSLAGAALATGGNQLSTLLTAMALVIFATFAPWALMRILPFTELAAGSAGMMRHELPRAGNSAMQLASTTMGGVELAAALPARLRQQAEDAGTGFSSRETPADASGPGAGSGPRDSSPSSPSGTGASTGVGTSTGFEQPAASSSEPAAASSASDTDARGPVRLPSIWQTDGTPWENQSERFLGPALTAGPFDADPEAGPVATDPEIGPVATDPGAGPVDGGLATPPFDDALAEDQPVAGEPGA